MRKIHLVIIDPQNDFSVENGPDGEKGALYVPGGEKDMRILANFIGNFGDKLEDISCSLDSHQQVHIAHPIFWVNADGDHPNPFTLISVSDVETGVWKASNPGWQSRALQYVKTLDINKRYVLCIWNPHCIIGTWGHAINKDVSQALNDWEKEELAKVNFVPKGNNPFTEHYSIVRADVEDDNDPGTKINTELINILEESDEILFTGEALGFCVTNTIVDIGDAFGEEAIRKFTLLRDTCSNIPGFENLGDDFVKNYEAKGMKVTTTTDYLS